MASKTRPEAAVLGDRLRTARDQAELSRSELGDRIGKSEKTLQRWESGTSSPDAPLLLQIADETRVSPVWLLTGEGPKNAPEKTANGRLHGQLVLPEDLEEGEGLPIMDVFAQAGREGGFVASEEPIGFLKPEENSPLYQLDNGTSQVYLLPIRGNSMAPTLRRGQLIPVQRFTNGTADIREDDIYVFRYEQEIFVKRLQKVRGGVIRVISDNEAYDPLEIELDDGTDFEVLGQVLV